MKKIFFGLFLAVMALALNSCEDDYFGPTIPDFSGDWVLIESKGQPINPKYADIYSFWRNGDGKLSYIDNFGTEIILPFTWDADEYTIYIRFRNPNYNPMFVYYDYQGRYMYFSESPNFVFYDVLERY